MKYTTIDKILDYSIEIWAPTNAPKRAHTLKGIRFIQKDHTVCFLRHRWPNHLSEEDAHRYYSGKYLLQVSDTFNSDSTMFIKESNLHKVMITIFISLARSVEELAEFEAAYHEKSYMNRYCDQLAFELESGYYGL